MAEKEPSGALSDAENQRERAKGMRKASVVDFHSLRMTWITNQLSAGTPIETVRMITGHQTTEVVLRHYFKPRLAQIAAAIHPPKAKKGPDPAEVLEKVRKGLKAMTVDNFARERTRLLRLLA